MVSPTRTGIRVETAAPGGETNAYVLGTDHALLVDPAAATPALDDALADRSLDHLLVTHTHPDHVGGVAAYADEATVWARAGYAERFERATGVTPDRLLHDRTTIETDDGEVEVRSMPGHAPDHVVLTVDESALVGDLAVATGSVVVGDDGDMRAYLTALRRLHARNPDFLYPGHGPIIDDPRTTLERLIRHRLRRERRILEGVRAGARTLGEITDTVYEKDVSGVRRLAEETVGAHLDKLAVEGSVAWDGECAAIREEPESVT